MQLAIRGSRHDFVDGACGSVALSGIRGVATRLRASSNPAVAKKNWFNQMEYGAFLSKPTRNAVLKYRYVNGVSRLEGVRSMRIACSTSEIPNPSGKEVNVSKQVLASKLGALQREQEETRKRLAAIDLAVSEAKNAQRQLSGKSEVRFNYGYIRETAGSYWELETTGVPKNIVSVANENFLREGKAIIRTLFPSKKDDTSQDPRVEEIRAKLAKLELSNAAIWERERSRPEVYSPWFIKGPYLALCLMLDVLFDGRPIERFWFLETVARTPYFAYNVMLYIYEVVGWWRRSSELRRVHFAEEWNEYHHLLIMESLGGDRSWLNRFLGLHSAIVYFLALLLLWLISPGVAYNFSELIEAHAVDTYAQFAEQNKDILKSLPPPSIATEYYEGVDMYMFDEFQTSRVPRSRRPTVDNLYDVFCNIRDDEGEHVKTMATCQMQDNMLKSPNKVAVGTGILASALAASFWLNNFASEEVLEVVEDIAGSVEVDGILEIVATLFPFL
mmetsp:Transcript_23944/g.45505  ORF Transcript_23944/g.45505 Transcript_23944/m.45505 type:complete len:502 (+) Transcript_23944:312-1817(+)